MIEAKVIPVGVIQENISIGRGPKGDKGDMGDVTPEAEAAKSAAQNAAETASAAAGMANTAASKAQNAVTQMETMAREILLSAHPVGSIYMGTSNVNPGTLFGGIWESWGSGRVPVGVNGSDVDFDGADKTGGVKTINLQHSHTVDSHSHTIAHTHTVNSHNHTTGSLTLNINQIPAHSHTMTSALGWPGNGDAGGDMFSGWGANSWPKFTLVKNTNNAGGTQSHNHGNTGDASPATSGSSTANSGGTSPGTSSQLSASQGIMPPYITCYMWKRIA
ncbi:phage baseplate protein [Hominifimenecus sp. rT4P-3]|uniref:phage baseplate protein n=1 Tax=Hominifimenecus sp. rT4P-3 TaxID=3242979 RepID=UPI003DA3923A